MTVLTRARFPTSWAEDRPDGVAYNWQQGAKMQGERWTLAREVNIESVDGLAADLAAYQYAPLLPQTKCSQWEGWLIDVLLRMSATGHTLAIEYHFTETSDAFMALAKVRGMLVEYGLPVQATVRPNGTGALVYVRRTIRQWRSAPRTGVTS